MGVVPQLDNLDVDVTVEDNLAVYSRLYRVKDVRGGGRSRPRRSPASPTAAARTVDKLSGGMRRRLLLARGLVHEPELLLLDEPTVGLDPQIRTELWSLIDGLRTRGKTILMSTHYIEEAERLADEVAVMHHGKVIARATPAELIAEHAGRETAEVYGPPDRLAEARALAESEGLTVRPAGPAIAIVGSENADQRRRPRRRGPPRRHARGRVRDAHRRGGRVMLRMDGDDAGRTAAKRMGGSSPPRSPA